MRKIIEDSGNDTTDEWESNGNDWVCVGGTFDGANVTFKASPDDGDTFVIVATDAVLTSPGWYALRLPVGVKLHAVITEAGSSTSITIWIS